MLINCDPKCGTTSPMCLLSTCTAVDQPREPTFANASKMAGLRGPAVAPTALDPPYPTYFIVRLPRNPAETIQTCSPKVQEAKYPNQVKRPKFMFGFVTDYHANDGSISGCGIYNYLAKIPSPYKGSVNITDASLAPWEVLTHDLDDKPCVTDVCTLPPWLSRPNGAILQTLIIHVNGKAAARNITIGGNSCQ
jgi:hypothetical protein